jgi:HK97 family phage major capsid protein
MSNDDRKRALSFSSQNVAVQRWFGNEILDHSPKSVRMDFMASGNAPLLMHHDMRQQVGVIDAASIKNGVGHATARFGRTGAASDALQNVDDGIYRNTSVGYRVHEMVLESSKNGEDTYRITDWEPYEASLVGVPADSTVGVGRNTEPIGAGPPGNTNIADPEARITRASSLLAVAATSTETLMTESTNAAAGTSAGTQATAVAAAGTEATRAAEVRVTTHPGPTGMELEQMRIAAIRNLCKANNFDKAQETRWISSGMPFDKASDEMLQIMEARGKSNPTTSVANLGLSENETQRFSVIRAIKAIADKDWSKAGFEAECSREISQRLNKNPDSQKFYVPYDVQRRAISPNALAARQRALNLQGMSPLQTRADVVGTLGSGGYLVETTNVGFIELLRNRSVAFRLGARALSGLVGNVNVPKQTGAASAFWTTSETNQITENEQTFGQMSLTPKTVGAYTEISRLLLLQSSPDVEGIVNADLAAVTALAVDTGALSGPGTGGQPLGITNTTGVGTASGMTTIAYAGQLNFQVAVANANVMPVAGAYATTPTVAALLMQRTRFANTATPLWDGNLWDANGPLGCAGFPGMSSKQIAAGTMLFGDWNSLIVAEWGVLEIEVNPYANFQAGIIGIRALMTCDIGLRYPGAFCVGSSIT